MGGLISDFQWQYTSDREKVRSKVKPFLWMGLLLLVCCIVSHPASRFVTEILLALTVTGTAPTFLHYPQFLPPPSKLRKVRDGGMGLWLASEHEVKQFAKTWGHLPLLGALSYVLAIIIS
jgi:hypothetical protein